MFSNNSLDKQSNPLNRASSTNHTPKSKQSNSKQKNQKEQQQLALFKENNPDFLSFEDVLKEQKGHKHHALLLRKEQIKEFYKPRYYGLSRKNVRKFYAQIQLIFAIPDDLIVQNRKMNISRDAIMGSFSQFYATLDQILLNKHDFEEDKRNILELFIRVFAVRMVSAIRKANISLLDILKVDLETFDKNVESIFNFKPAPQDPDLPFKSVYSRRTVCGKRVTDYYMLEEMLKTPKQILKNSMDHNWNDDSHLHAVCFRRLRSFFKDNKQFLQTKDITNRMYRNGTVTHFRATTVSELYEYLVSNKVYHPEQQLRVLDTSIGWLDRLLEVLAYFPFIAYTGFDPNKKVIEGAKRLVQDLGHYKPRFRARFYSQGIGPSICSQTLVEENGGPFDFAVTSPPYFKANELYDPENPEQQAWHLYQREDEFTEFLAKLMRVNYEALRAGGMFALNYRGDTVVKTALKLINASSTYSQSPITIWKTGFYYPHPETHKKSGEHISEEFIYFIRRENLIANPSRLLTQQDSYQTAEIKATPSNGGTAIKLSPNPTSRGQAAGRREGLI
jgi:hypothetical protein